MSNLNVKFLSLVCLFILGGCKKLEKCSDAKSVEECKSPELSEKCFFDMGLRSRETGEIYHQCTERLSKEDEQKDFEKAKFFCGQEFLRLFNEDVRNNCDNIHLSIEKDFPSEIGHRYICKTNDAVNLVRRRGDNAPEEIRKSCTAIRERDFESAMGL